MALTDLVIQSQLILPRQRRGIPRRPLPNTSLLDRDPLRFLTHLIGAVSGRSRTGAGWRSTSWRNLVVGWMF
jgi:hypothetical protein